MSYKVLAIGGWRTPSRDIVKEYTAAQKRAPNNTQLTILRRLAQRNNDVLKRGNVVAGHPSRSDEMDFNTAQYLISFYIKNNRGPEHSDPVGPKPGPETTAVIKGAVGAVPKKHSWLDNVVRTAGKAAHSVTHAVSSATGEVSKLAGKVPVVGGALHGAFSITFAPFKIADDIAGGGRIDRVGFRAFKHTIQDIHEVAPYAQTIISTVPGVGSGISGAIGASLAMAEGVPITKVFEEGIKDSLPGGPLAKSIFSVSTAVLAGKPIDEVAISAIPINDKQKQALIQGLKLTKDIAAGKNVSKSLVKAAQSNLHLAVSGLPQDIQKSLKVGIATGNAIKLQSIVKNKTPELISGLTKIGAKVALKNDVFKEASKIVPNGKKGFLIGVGLVQHQVSPSAVLTVRNSLTGDNRKAFDTALSTHVGLVTSKKPNLPPAALAGYYTTLGMRGATTLQKTSMMKAISSNPKIKAGAVHAINQVDKAKKSWWYKVKEFLGI